MTHHAKSQSTKAFMTLSLAFIALFVLVFSGPSQGFAAQSQSQSQSPDENTDESVLPVSPLIELDRPLVVAGDASPLFVLIRFRAADLDPDQIEARPPVNLSLVLDRSGSMSDKGKIEYLKKAAGMAVDRLNAKDFLSVVEYDDEITLLWPSQPVESTFAVKRLIDALEPRGTTNLVGGMMRGAGEVAARKSQMTGMQALHRVLLLSDGLANEGVTEPAEIRRLVREAKTGGVRITTLGLGRDYDEDLMQAIAENGGGNYYYIENPEQMARIFERELNTLFSTVAKDVRFDFEPGAGVKGVEVISFGDAGDSQSTHFDMESFYAGEERTILLRIEPQADLFQPDSGTLSLGRLAFSYLDIGSGTRAEFTSEIEVTVTTDAQAAVQAVNHEVTVEANLFEAEKRHELAIEKYEQGERKEADEMMATLQKDVEEQNLLLKDQRLSNKIEALSVEREQMSQAQDAAQQSSYLKSTKQRLFNAQKGKRDLYLLQVGDKGFEVESLQKALRDKGYYQGPIDGIYSEDVKTAIESLQAAEQLDVDGVAGPATMQTLGLY